jgi:hypothetical protein
MIFGIKNIIKMGIAGKNTCAKSMIQKIGVLSYIDKAKMAINKQ